MSDDMMNSLETLEGCYCVIELVCLLEIHSYFTWIGEMCVLIFIPFGVSAATKIAVA